ncbi:MAG: hypothetical protein ACXWT5_06085 [Methylophilus sp.]|jgi:hypothetical protein
MAINYVPENLSGTITTGETAQLLDAANDRRVGWFIQNNSAGSLWINDTGGTAILGQPSIEIKTGTTLSAPRDLAPTSQAISIIGATTGQTFTAREWSQ